MRRRQARTVALTAVTVMLLGACSDDAPTPPTTAPTSALTTDPTTGATTAGPTTTLAAPTTAAPTTAAPTTAAPTTAAPPPAGPASAAVKLTKIASLEQPVAVAVRVNDPTLYVAERVGRIRAIREPSTSPTVVLYISDRTKAEGERGLLGLAISPAGDRGYVNFTDRSGNSQVEEYTIGPDGTFDTASRRNVLSQEQPYSNHNGGNLAFGPDAMLYIGFGDGGSANDPGNRAQNLGTWLGKLLRIDPRPSGDQPYQIPTDNPFVATAGARPEIWAYGLRNPWRYSFDPANGDLWIGDVGQNAVEEVDLARAAGGTGRGANYGWKRFEGTTVVASSVQAPGAVAPLFTFKHSAGACSVTGGAVYRGSAIPALVGTYVFSDLCWGELRAWSAATGVVRLAGTGAGQIVSIQYGPDGELYVCDLTGTLYRLAPA